MPLRVAITGKGASDTRLLLKAAGLAPDFPVQYLEFQSGHLVIEALNSDALDFGGSSEIPPVFSAASTVQSFLQVGVLHGDVNNQAVLVPKGPAIRDLRDLKGKRVGYVRATTSQYFLIEMLRSVGLSWSDIEPVALTVSDGVAAFSQGALDALGNLRLRDPACRRDARSHGAPDSAGISLGKLSRAGASQRSGK
ncbi:ABC transporter substrate-binding protein [uncultured Novosphingobium sp.]|uniref:ABC transporter substrate-binding protein n=1 Tax=uncultured Novosphingobium sp. TaxID=292277 RepID=UPI0025869C71|nr:ABC transporter substrate-binding protein [uncultured Novosphingobium sp.]